MKNHDDINIAYLVAQWEQLDQLDLDEHPFIMGRQAKCIDAGCPFRHGTEKYRLFMEGMRAQDDYYTKYPRDNT
jgi:hypothetical protein